MESAEFAQSAESTESLESAKSVDASAESVFTFYVRFMCVLCFLEGIPAPSGASSLSSCQYKYQPKISLISFDIFRIGTNSSMYLELLHSLCMVFPHLAVYVGISCSVYLSELLWYLLLCPKKRFLSKKFHGFFKIADDKFRKNSPT